MRLLSLSPLSDLEETITTQQLEVLSLTTLDNMLMTNAISFVLPVHEFTWPSQLANQ
jgi:hypothetical protein